MKRGPDFIGIGMMRSATSWIAKCLAEHPEIYMPIKEIHFFNGLIEWRQGDQWYFSFFKNCPPEKKCGEFSPFYLAKSQSAERIYERFPKIKLIVSLRDPTQRAISHYFQNIRTGKFPRNMSFEKALEINLPAMVQILEFGNYATHLKKYFNLFPRQQILIVFYDEIIDRPLETIQKIYKFLEIDENFVPQINLTKKINAYRLPRSFLLEKILDNLVVLSKLIMPVKFWQLIDQLNIHDFIEQKNSSDKKNPNWEISKKSLEIMKNYYLPEIKELKSLLHGNDLPNWLND